MPWHAHGHHRQRLVACHGLPWSVPWPALGGCQGMPRPALVEGCRAMPVGTTKPRLVACHGLPLGVPWHAMGGAKARRGLPWGCDPGGCHGMPWWVPWGCQGMPWLALLGARACPAGCHGAAKACHSLPCWVPWWAPWHAITLNPVPRCIYSFGNDPNCAPKFFIGHLGRVPCFNSH